MQVTRVSVRQLKLMTLAAKKPHYALAFAARLEPARPKWMLNPPHHSFSNIFYGAAAGRGSVFLTSTCTVIESRYGESNGVK